MVVASRYLDDLLNIDNIYFDQMVDSLYPTELQLNKANFSDTKALFFYLKLQSNLNSSNTDGSFTMAKSN